MSDIDSAGMRLVRQLARCIVPIYGKNESSKPIHLGTGLLVTDGTAVFLASAGHVITKLRNTPAFVYISECFGFNVSGATIIVPDVERGTKIDVGVVKLERQTPALYRGFSKQPLPIKNLMGNALPRDNKRYHIVGVPGTKSRFHAKNKVVNAFYHSLLTRSTTYDSYANLNVKPFNSIVLSYNHKRCFKLNGRMTNFPDIDGMSGSPVFLFDDESSVFDTRKSFVVGILIEYHKNKQAIIATDARYLLDLIARL